MKETSATNVVENTASNAINWLAENHILLVQYAMNVITAILILIVGNWITKKIAASIALLLKKRELDHTVVDFLENFSRYLMLVMVLIAALGRLGVQTAQIVAVIGAAGLAIGLALQGSLSNFAAGVLIVTFRPFKASDYVEVAGVSGFVSSIQIFSTVLTTPDNKMVVVPNGTIISSPITNYSRHETRRVDYVIGVSYKSDLQKVKNTLERIVNADSRVLQEPALCVGVQALADSSVNFVVRPWVKTEDYWGVYFDLLQAIKEGLDEEGIEIPFPQMDVHHHQSQEGYVIDIDEKQVA